MVSEKLKDLVAFCLFYQNYLNDFEEHHSKDLVEVVRKHFLNIKNAKDAEHATKCSKGEPCLRCFMEGLYHESEQIIQKFK